MNIFKITEFDGQPSSGYVDFYWNNDCPCISLIHSSEAIQLHHENNGTKYGEMIKKQHSVKGEVNQKETFLIDNLTFNGGISGDASGIKVQAVGNLKIISGITEHYGLEISDLGDVFDYYDPKYAGKNINYAFNCISFQIQSIDFNLFIRDGKTYIIKLSTGSITQDEVNAIGTVFSVFFGFLFEIKESVGFDKDVNVVSREQLCNPNLSSKKKRTFSKRKNICAEFALNQAFDGFIEKNSTFDIVRATSIFYNAMESGLAMRFAQYAISFDVITNAFSKGCQSVQHYFPEKDYKKVKTEIYNMLEKNFPDVVDMNKDAIKGKIAALNNKSMADKTELLEKKFFIEFTDEEKDILKKRNPAVHSGFISKTNDLANDLDKVVKLEKILVKIFAHSIGIREYMNLD